MAENSLKYIYLELWWSQVLFQQEDSKPGIESNQEITTFEINTSEITILYNFVMASQCTQFQSLCFGWKQWQKLKSKHEPDYWDYTNTSTQKREC